MLNAEPLPLDRRRARPRGRGSSVALSCFAAVLALGIVAAASAETWRGLMAAPKHRCAPYDKKRDYHYPQSVEPDIVRELGVLYGPYPTPVSHSPRRLELPRSRGSLRAYESLTSMEI